MAGMRYAQRDRSEPAASCRSSASGDESFNTGFTQSTNFPVTAAAFQKSLKGTLNAFVTKVNAGGGASFAYSTYLGGSAYEDSIPTIFNSGGIAADKSGDAYVTGFTLSADFPLAGAIQGTLKGQPNAFVTELNPAGSDLLFSTYLGGSVGDFGTGIALDSAGDPVISGFTYSSDFPVVNSIQASNHGASDAFVVKLATSAPPPTTHTSADFDGDGKADLAIFRPGSGNWFIASSKNPGSPISQLWGTTGDIPLIADFDGDGRSDIAVFRPSGGTWWIIPSGNPATVISAQWGTAGDIPVPGDYDGDGKADFAVWRPSTGTFWVIPSSTPAAYVQQQWGTAGDIPVPGDYDGDGKTDFAVWRPSTGTFWMIPSAHPSSVISQAWGVNSDLPVPGDYDGDGKTDFAVWRPSTGTWFVIPSANPGNVISTQWGAAGDVPVPRDYDGDHKTDVAVWRPSSGTWYVLPSATSGTFTSTPWGVSTDAAVNKPTGQ
jgi:FG-GAP-like repeat/Beta-propeller repeat